MVFEMFWQRNPIPTKNHTMLITIKGFWSTNVVIELLAKKVSFVMQL